MTHDRDPFDGPSPVGPLGDALRDLTGDAPPAGFTEWQVRAQHHDRGSFRRQVLGGLVGVAAAIGLLVLFIGFLGTGGSDTAASLTSSAANMSTTSTASSSAASASSSTVASGSSAATSASSAGSASVSQEAGGGAPAPGSSAPDGAPPQATGAGTAAPSDPSFQSSDGGCRAAPLSDAARQAVKGLIPGLTPDISCALDDSDLGVQRWTLTGGSLVAALRAGVYDPCADGSAACTDVPDRPGVRTAEVNGATVVWVGGRDGSAVLTATPAGVLPVTTLADAATALAATAG